MTRCESHWGGCESLRVGCESQWRVLTRLKHRFAKKYEIECNSRYKLGLW